MRIATVTERARGSGASEAAWNLAASLQDAGHEVGYFYAESSGPAQDAFPGAGELGRWQRPNREIREMKLRTPGSRAWLDAHIRRRTMLAEIREATIRRLTAFEPDVVHLHNVAAIGGHVLASTVLRRWPTVWTAHDRYPFELFHNTWEIRGEISTTWEYSPGPEPARAGLEMFRASPLSMQFLVPSQWLADIAADRLDGSSHRVEVVSNVIPTGAPDADAPRLADALGADLVVLAVIPTPTYPLKGFDTVREAVRLANEHLAERRIALVVTTDTSLGLTDEHIYTTPELFGMGLIRQSGYLDKASMAALYRSVDVVTIASWIENLPNVAIEAAAASRPVIASAVGGIPEVVRPDQTGWLVDPGDSDAMARCLVAATLDTGVRVRYGARAFADYQARYDPAVVRDQHLGIYTSVANEWEGDEASRNGNGVDFSTTAFTPPRKPSFDERSAIERYARAAYRRVRGLLGSLRRWYHRRLAGEA